MTNPFDAADPQSAMSLAAQMAGYSTEQGDSLASGVVEISRRRLAAAKYAVDHAREHGAGRHPIGYLEFGLSAAEEEYRMFGGDPGTVAPDWAFALITGDAADGRGFVGTWRNVPAEKAHWTGDHFEADYADVHEEVSS